MVQAKIALKDLQVQSFGLVLRSLCNTTPGRREIDRPPMAGLIPNPPREGVWLAS